MRKLGERGGINVTTAKTNPAVTGAVQFLLDEPADDDFFGSHGRVACAIADVVRGPDPVHVIGLLGSWGSGKSTVVRHMARHLDQHPDKDSVHFFTYDAWLHQSDPPRRAFLEALIADLTEHGLIKAADWAPKLSELNGRLESTVTTTSRRLSEAGKWIFLSLGLVPLGLGLLDYDLIDKAFGKTPTTLAKLTFWFSLLMTVAPLVAVGALYASWRSWKQSYAAAGWTFLFSAPFWLEHDAAHRDQSVLALLTDQSVEKAENRTRISPEPSAIEFRDVFQGVLHALKHPRRLIIVIDNLDRLAESEAMQLWATIRSLFLNDGRTLSEDNDRRAIVVLPIDESSIKRMFEASHPHEADVLATAFIDKTFDITFHVNDPVMSDWRAYLAGHLKSAFGDAATVARVYWITRIIEDRISRPGSGKITPRKIIKITNSIGALLVQWGDGAIDLLAMAFYVVHRVELTRDIRATVADPWPIMDASLAQWRRQVVALHFGVAPERAFQTLLMEPLRTAIASNDAEEFRTLLQTEGAASVAEDLFRNIPAKGNGGAADADFVANAVVLLAASGISNEIWVRQSLGVLGKAWASASELSAWRPDFAQIVQGFESLGSADVQTAIAATVVKIEAVLAGVKLDEHIVATLAHTMDALKALSSKHQHNVPILSPVLDTLNLQVLIANLPAVNRPHLRIDKSAAEYVKILADSLATPDGASQVPALVRALGGQSPVLFKGAGKLDWDPLAAAASALIQQHPATSDFTGPAIDVLGLLHAKSAQTRANLVQLFDQGRLLTLANEFDAAKDPDRLADIAALMSLKGSDFSGPNSKTWLAVVEEHPGFVDGVGTALTWYLWGNGTTAMLNAAKSRPSFLPVIKELAKRDITKSKAIGIGTAFLLENMAMLENYVGKDEASRALGYASSRQTFWTDLGAVTDDGNYLSVVGALARSNAVEKSQLETFVRERLSQIESSAWRNALSDGAPPMPLINFFHATFSSHPNLGDELKTAMMDMVSQLPKAAAPIRDRWFFLSHYLSDGVRITMLKNLRDLLHAGAAVSDLPGLLETGGKDMLSSGGFAVEADKTARHLLLPLLGIEAGRDFLLRNADFFRGISRSSETATKVAIREALDTMTEPDQEPSDELKQLQTILGA